MNEISRWLIVSENKYKYTNQWSLPLLSWSQHCIDMYTETEERIPNITNIKDFMDFTIYRGEIWKYTKEIWRFTRISLIYTRIFRKRQSKCVYISVTYCNNRTPNKLQTNRCPLKRGNIWSEFTFGSQILKILKITIRQMIKDLIEIHGFHNIRGEIHKILLKSDKSTMISE